MHKGSCLCGDVAFEISGDLRPVLACHCTQCRKTSGHFWAATSAADSTITLTHKAGLKWFRASDTAQRGFCATCGSSLFWKPDGQARTAIAAGAFDTSAGLTLAAHVFVADKGDYYAISDGCQQFQQFSGGENA